MSFLRPILLFSVLVSATLGGELPVLSGPHASPSADSGASHSHHHDKHNQVLNVPPGTPVPQVKLVLHPDAVKGWNLEVQVENFRFAPERVNAESQFNEGHGHLYIDGKKITRLYSSWYYLPQLEPGAEVRVSLHGNGHEVLAVDNQPVAATTHLKAAGHHSHH